MRSHPITLAVGFCAVLLVVACESDSDTSPQPAFDGGGITLDGGSSSSSGSSGSDSSAPDTSTPGPGDTAIVQLAVGRYSSCVRRKNGTVSCWGRNSFGELGRGTQSPTEPPGPVTGLNDAIDVSVGEAHACAVHASGAVSCWGANAFGQLGDGSPNSTRHLTPQTVLDTTTSAPFADGATVHASFSGFNCIRRKSGAVVCWSGQNNVGQTGDGASDERNAPGANVTGITNPLEVVKGDSHACVRLATGVSCWGANQVGQCGNGVTGTLNKTPVAATAITDAVELMTGLSFTCWRQTAGTVRCVGNNHVAQLGNGTKDPTNGAPTNVSGLTDATQLSGDESHVCALRTGGKVSCWGKNIFGALGDGTKDERVVPVEVVGLTDAVYVGSGKDFSCALRANGEVVCWGSNNSSELGDGTKMGRPKPGPVLGL